MRTFKLFAAVSSAWLSVVAAAPALKAGVFMPVMPAPEFTLHASDGGGLSLTHFRGKVVLLAFGFTSCGEVCPITLATLADVRRKLGPDATDLQVVYVTVDPQRDDATRMHKYLATFDPTFVGGTGTPAEIDAVRKLYGISAEKHMYPDGKDAIAHSSSVFIIDRAGGLAALMPYGHSADDYVHDLRILLRK
jgi:protein SCO1/2